MQIEVCTGALDTLEQSALPGAGDREPEKVERKVLPVFLHTRLQLLQMKKISSLPSSLSVLEIFQTVGKGDLKKCH